MYEQTNTMMETKTIFQIPQLLDGDDFTSEDLADDMEGLRLSFTRIKIPGGGHLQFEIPSGNPDVPDYAPYLEGVILYSHNSNAYWPEGSEYDDDQPPLCQSFDGKVGYGEPGGTCVDCVLNQFGSDGNNKGKACKNMRMLYLLRSGEYMPIQIALPPTSLTPYTRFVNEAFLSRRRGADRAEEGRQRQPRILRRHLYQDRRFRRGRPGAYPRLRGWLCGTDQGHQRAESAGRRRSLQHHRGRRCLASGVA